ncbi:serine/threonine-protein kinase [Tengunoibacter tsumagoiensis]|uniref:non-specific serine/threonine protein kinase n=1 Tax=Tengunoibacter tsumagoiensis TaxID=2014871 RepID=A0A401ZVC6_9CHLR|nr:serine/threonine-protein kinase [Tengunoibacter tsumagoiensis]GCE10843.1 hypothetical protein KTT_07020 [Tengunoibacter tsumagoiensis]
MGDRIGQQLGNYRLLRLLGQGSFADVYLGEHIHLHTQAAIKVLQVRLVENSIDNFLNEARTIAHLVHPYIIRVLDFGVQETIPFLVMDYAPKGTFRQRFLQGRPLPPAPLASYMRQAAAALQYAHERKLIHRDVKPENMLLGPNDEVLLSDFGFALTAQSFSSSSVTETAGTAIYMAPEQLQGKPRAASDQYSLGIIAYEWLTGERPFDGSFFEIASQQMLTPPPAMRDKVPTIPREIEQVVMTALAKDPQKRYLNVRDFALALSEACLSAKQFGFDLPTTTLIPEDGQPSAHFSQQQATNSSSQKSPATERTGPLSQSGNQSRNEKAITQQGSFKVGTPSAEKSMSFTPPEDWSKIAPPTPSEKLRVQKAFQQVGKRTNDEEKPTNIDQPVSQPFPSLSLKAHDVLSGIQIIKPDEDIVTKSEPEPSPRNLEAAQNLHPSLSGIAIIQPDQLTSATTDNTSLNTRKESADQSLPTSKETSDQSKIRSQTAPVIPKTPKPLPTEKTPPIATFSSEFPVPNMPPVMDERTQTPPVPQSFQNMPPVMDERAQTPSVPQSFQMGSPASMPASPQADPLDKALQQPPLIWQPANQPKAEPLVTPRAQRLVQTVAPIRTPPTDNTNNRKALLRPAPTGAAPIPSRRSSSRFMRLDLLILLIIIIGGGSLLFYWAFSRTGSDNANQAQHTIQATSTALQQQNASATAAARANSVNATATATTRINQDPYAPNTGTLVLNSDMTANPDKLWSETNDPGGTGCQFAQDGYHALAPAQLTNICVANTTNYTNFTYEAQMTFVKIGTSYSSGGLIFHRTSSQYYRFEIFESGKYQLALCSTISDICSPAVDGAQKASLPIDNFNPNLNQPNTIAVVDIDKTITIYVNGKAVFEPFTDKAQNLTSGSIGVFSRGGQAKQAGEEADIVFTKVRVWKQG